MEQNTRDHFEALQHFETHNAQSTIGAFITTSQTSPSKDGPPSLSRAQSHRSGQITPPLTPSTSSEDLTPHALPSQAQFHDYLRAFYPFHPPLEESDSTVTLPLNQGDIVLIHSVHSNGWADGTLLDSGHRGWLPTNYCEAYDPDHIRNLMKSLTLFYDNVRSCSDGDLASLCNQDYMRGLIAGTRHLLESTGCLSREAPQVSVESGSSTLRRYRKAVLAELTALVKLSKSIEDCLKHDLHQHIMDCEYLDHMVLRAFKLVLRAAKFYDAWMDEVEYEQLAQPNFDAAGFLDCVPPTPPADSTYFGVAIEGPENPCDAASDGSVTGNIPSAISDGSVEHESLCQANKQFQPHHRPASQSLGNSRTAQTNCHHFSRPISFQLARQSTLHRVSWSVKPAAAQSNKLASQRLISAHQNFLSFLEGFVGPLLLSQSSNEVLVATGGAVHAGRALLTVVDAVWERSESKSEQFQTARDNMYGKIAELVHAAQFIFIPSQESEMEEYDPENRQRLGEAATDCVRLAGDCLASTRTALEAIGDFEFETTSTSPFEGVDFLGCDNDQENDNVATEEEPPASESSFVLQAQEQPTSFSLPKRSQSLPRLDTKLPLAEHAVSSTGVLTPPSSRLSTSSLLPPLPLITPSSLMDHSPSSGFSSAIASDLRSAVSRVDSVATTFADSTQCSERGRTSVTSTRATSPETPALRTGACDLSSSFHSSQDTLDDVSEEAEDTLLEKTFGHELVFAKDGQISGGSLRALVERLTTHDSTPDALFVSTFYLTFRIFTTPISFAQALIDRFHYVDESPSAAVPVKLRVYNVFKGWLESHWRRDCDKQALDLIISFASNELSASIPATGSRLVELTSKVSSASSQLVPRLVSSMGKTNTSIAQYVPPDAPIPSPIVSKSDFNHLKAWKYGSATPSITDFDPQEIARQLTIKESRIFSSILPEELLSTEWTKKSGSIAVNVRAMSTLSTDLANLVADSVLQSDEHSKRAKIIKQWVKIGAKCLELNNYDSLMAIVCSLNSTTILRLKRTWESLSSKTKATFERLKSTVDVSKNYSTLRQRLTNCAPPCIPFVGIYLTDLTFVDVGNQNTRILPGSRPDDAVSVINFHKHVKTAKIISELQRFQVPYHLYEVPELQTWIQDQLVRVRSSEDAGESSVNKLYRRSCMLEPREQAILAKAVAHHEPLPTGALSTVNASSITKSMKEKGELLGLVFKTSSAH